METILGLGNNKEAFSEALIELQNDNKIVRFLDRMEDYTRDERVIPKENIPNIVQALMEQRLP